MYMPVPSIGLGAITFASDPAQFTQGSTLSAYSQAFVVTIQGEESKLKQYSSLIGIVTAIVGNILISFALNIQRYAHIRLHKEWQEKNRASKRSSGDSSRNYGTTHYHNDEQGDTSDTDESTSSDGHHNDKEEPYIKSPYWWGGIALMTVGEAGNFLAYGFAPASIVSPLGVVALVSNCLIAPIMLKEKFRFRDFAGVVVAVAGAVTVVLSANQEDVQLGPHEVISYITTPTFEAYMAVTIALMAILAYLSPKYGSKTILIDLGLVGLFGGYTALSTKGVASMLSSTLWKAFTTPITYILIAVLIVTAILQVKYVNKALQRFDSTQVIPVQFVMFTISVIIGSAVLYRDFEHADTAMFIKFFGGCILTFSGVWLITSGRSKNDDEDYDSSDDESDSGDSRRIRTGDQNYEREETPKPRFMDGQSHNGNISPSESRRSSKVSFATALDDRASSRVERRESVPSVVFSTSTPYAGLDEENPWARFKDGDGAPRQPILTTTSSSPMLEHESAIDTEPSVTHPPLQRSPLSRTTSQANPHTHPNLQQPGPPQADSLAVQRPVTPRASLSQRMLPGPYLSPLGGSLSAVVADSARRLPSHRRSKSSLRRRKSGAQSRDGARALSYNDRAAEEEALLGTSLQQASTNPHLASYASRGNTNNNDTIIDYGTQRVTRTRSLSNTLGAFLDVMGRSRHDEHNRGNDTGESGSGSRDVAGPSRP